jgi:hypothetical protein
VYEFGKEANQDFERKFLGPRANLAEYMDMDADGNLDAAPDDVARWKSAHALGEEANPRGGDGTDVQKAIERQRCDEAAAQKETLNEWKARTDYLAGRAQRAAEGGEEDLAPADPWVHERISKIHGGHQGGDQVQKDIAGLQARLAEGENLERFYEETNEMLDTNYQRAVELKWALAHVDTTV